MIVSVTLLRTAPRVALTAPFTIALVGRVVNAILTDMLPAGNVTESAFVPCGSAAAVFAFVSWITVFTATDEISLRTPVTALPPTTGFVLTVNEVKTDGL